MIQIMYEAFSARYDEVMNKTLCTTSAIVLLICASGPAAAACTVCHSKNPKMASMHKALEYKDCFKCHGPASDRKTPNAKDEKTTDLLCVNCHGQETPAEKE